MKKSPLFLIFLAVAACRPPAPVLAPPREIRDIQGLASLRISQDGRTSRSKFAYAVALPDRGRIEVFDPLGRTILQFLIDGQEAYLILPSKKVYARGERSEVLEKFLGFPLRLDEIVGLLAGRWGGDGEAPLEGWSIDRDARGRVTGGLRPGLSFAVLDFFGGVGLPRRFSFRGGTSQGTVAVLEIFFNRAFAPPSWAFRERFRELPWDEIERLLRDES